MAAELIWQGDRLLHVKYSGTFTGAEARAVQDKIGADVRFDDLIAIILDASRIEQNLTTAKDVEIISAISRAQSLSNPNLKNAVVLEPSDDGQAQAAFYKILTEVTGWQIKLFNTEAEARAWLVPYLPV